MLLNLLSNAVKFSPAGATIQTQAEDMGDFVRFSVTDEGPGIDASLRARLFEPFIQGESPMVKKHQGTGLGLAITKRLVERHGGSIEVHSTPGHGATFSFTLPADAMQGAMAVEIVPRSAAEKLVPGELNRLLAPGERPARVLVIDDDPRVASLLGAALEPAGYSVLSATSGQAGIEAVSKNPPDAIVLDLTMPEMSGFDVLAALRLGHVTPAIPVIVLTAADLTEAQRAELKRDAVALASKGDLSQPALVALLERVIVSTDDGVPRAAGTGPLVLVVDDNDLNRTLACSLLERHGYRVLEADSGDAGVTAARQARPALVLLDLAMPGKNGFVTLAELRADASTAKIPVVALTALAMRGDEAEVRAAGFDAYLTKPIQQAEFVRTIAELVHRGRADLSQAPPAAKSPSA